jgi:NADPH oxidase
MEDPIAKTWTRKFKEYLESVSGNVVGTNHFPFFFNHVDHRGDTQVGQLQDSEGRQLIRVDGPHSAPSEHFTNYGTCMIVGGGIGLTPCASVISALIKHRWKRGLNPEILHLYWVVRQGEVDSFQWLVHLLTELSYEYKKAREENTIASNMYCEFNIFVTAVDKKEKKQPLPFQKPKRRYTGNSSTPLFTADALYNLMLNPNVPSKKMIDTMKRGGNPPNRLQDVWVWDGRPEWDQIFADVKDQRQHSDIGVCFCGAPVIGNDLKKMCERYSSSKDDCLFTLHKENF